MAGFGVSPKRAMEVEAAEQMALGQPMASAPAASAPEGARFGRQFSDEDRKRQAAQLAKMLRERK